MKSKKNIIQKFLIVMVRAYQFGISPYIGAHCRYTPTCSAYFIEAVEKY